MYLSNHEAVTLVQVLAIYGDSHLSAGTSDFQRAVDALRKRVEDELSGDARLEELRKAVEEAVEEGDEKKSTLDDLLDDDNEEEELVDEEADDDGEAEEDPAGEEDEEERAVTGEGGEPQEEATGVPGESKGDGLGGGERLRADIEHTCHRLTKLAKLSTPLGDARFKIVDGALQFQVNGEELVVDDVDYAKRLVRAIHVRDGWGEWHVFNVTRFPKAWQKTFPVNKMVEVVE